MTPLKFQELITLWPSRCSQLNLETLPDKSEIWNDGFWGECKRAVTKKTLSGSTTNSTRIKGINKPGLKPDPNTIGARLLQAVPSPLCPSCSPKPLMIICCNRWIKCNNSCSSPQKSAQHQCHLLLPQTAGLFHDPIKLQATERLPPPGAHGNQQTSDGYTFNKQSFKWLHAKYVQTSVINSLFNYKSSNTGCPKGKQVLHHRFQTLGKRWKHKDVGQVL